MKFRRAMGLLAALAMSASLLAVTPSIAAAAGSYSLDGGSPAGCPGTTYVWGSNQLYNPSGATGYIQVQLAYCPAWQVVWTRAYNYTSRSSVLLATGIQRWSTNGNGQYDYVNRTCGTFCLDWVAKGTRSYGAQLWVPSNFSSYGGRLRSTVYYCINSSCSSYQALTVDWNMRTAIVNMANAKSEQDRLLVRLRRIPGLLRRMVRDLLELGVGELRGDNGRPQRDTGRVRNLRRHLGALSGIGRCGGVLVG